MEDSLPSKSSVAGDSLGDNMAAAVSVNLEPGQLSSPIKSGNNGNGRKVKRYIHCSDGVYEEFSSDEEGVYPVPVGTSLVDPKTMTWIPWFSHVSSKALAACDYVGETLADFLGITAPKYQYEIDEAKRMQEEEKAAKKAVDLEMAGWRDTASPSTSDRPQIPQTSTPVSILPKMIPDQSSQASGTHI